MVLVKGAVCVTYSSEENDSKQILVAADNLVFQNSFSTLEASTRENIMG